MNKIVKLMMLIAIFSGCDLSDSAGFSQEPRGSGGGGSIPDAQVDYVFDLGAVPTITIFISTNQWNTLLTNYDNFAYNEEDVIADFTFNKGGEVVSLMNISFRLRGNTSRRRPEGIDPGSTNTYRLHGEAGNLYHTAHFRLGFNDFVSGQHLYGLRNLNLKFFKDDPNYVREIFGYDLYRRFGIPWAPRASYARVFIEFKETGENVYFGPYIMLESVDKSYLISTFTNNWQGYLWKCYWGADYDTGSADGGNAGVEWSTPTAKNTPDYDLKSDAAMLTNYALPVLQDFIIGLNSRANGSADLKNWLDANLAVDEFIRYLAVSLVLGNWDSYMGNGANHYIYFDESHKAHFIPFDLDNIMGNHYSTGFTPSGMDVNAWQNTDIPLSYKVLSIPEYYADYTNYLYELTRQGSAYFDVTAVTNRILELRGLIDPAYMTGIEVQGNAENNNNTIEDKAGTGLTGWAVHPYYRLFSGGTGGDGINLPGDNFVKSSQVSVASQLGFPVPNWSGYAQNVGQMYMRGDFNSWGSGSSYAMTLVSDYTWELAVSGMSSGQRYKFVSHATDWGQPNWGDDDQDYVGDLDGANITNTYSGTVTFRFNDSTLVYTNFN